MKQQAKLGKEMNLADLIKKEKEKQQAKFKEDEKNGLDFYYYNLKKEQIKKGTYIAPIMEDEEK